MKIVQIWQVNLKHERYDGCREEIYVKAFSASGAEKKALALAPKLDGFLGIGKRGIYVSEAKFHGYLYL